MRIWDIHPSQLCDKHLLGEHRELHCLFNILTQNLKGYSQHPETLRWVGRTKALYNRHDDLVREMRRRNFNHQSPLADVPLEGPENIDRFLDSVPRQINILREKGCKCVR